MQLLSAWYRKPQGCRARICWQDCGPRFSNRDILEPAQELTDLVHFLRKFKWKCVEAERNTGWCSSAPFRERISLKGRMRARVSK